MIFDEGSFRDPAGQVFYHLDKIYRLIDDSGKERVKFLEQNDLIKKLKEKNFLINSKILDDKDLKNLGFDKNYLVIEHEKIPYISYPYEWSFSQLKSAALLHLDFHLFLLNNDATLIDASAYNIQFIGAKPIFIDILSIKVRRRDGYTQTVL